MQSEEPVHSQEGGSAFWEDGLVATPNASGGAATSHSKAARFKDNPVENTSDATSCANYSPPTSSAYPSLPTEASLREYSQHRKDVANKMYGAKVGQISFESFQYPNEDFAPELTFIRFLAPAPHFTYKSRDRHAGHLKLRIATTVLNVGFNSSVFYTDADGYVVRKDDVSSSRIGRLMCDESTKDEDIVALDKRKFKGNGYVTPILSKELKLAVERKERGGIILVQQHVHCSGSKVPALPSPLRGAGTPSPFARSRHSLPLCE
ncbi:hypothetical protein CYMTET_52830, partial [Cymbomonas tetramitiformis]